MSAGEWLRTLEELTPGDSAGELITAHIDGRQRGEVIEIKLIGIEEDRICYAMGESNMREFLGAREYERRARPAMIRDRSVGRQRKELGVPPQPRYSPRSIRLAMQRGEAIA